MADYTLTAKLTADAKDLQRGFSQAQESLADLQGKTAQFGDTFKDMGKRISSVGDNLTKKITKPALIATTAATGLVSALGFKRLIGMDNAQAKLQGLGYEGESVESIMRDVEEAVSGTTHTMAEGVDTAAGALAAGVEEGKELERYIKLVGDAAVGSNRPMDEMSQIFNRVQGSGKLMTQELNMIEMGMPGFSQAMADHLADGSLEAFRDMVTNGEVGSDEFLNVMEGFAGGMSDAYAGTWEGLAKNVLSNIGIIGEALMDGLFVDGKKAMEGFLEILRSDELRQWASETGERIRSAFQGIADAVVNLKSMWDALSPPIQDVIKKVSLFGAGFMVALGPILKIVGMLASGFGALVGAISFLMSPIGLVAIAVAGLAAAFIYAWNTSEIFRDFVLDAFERIQEVIMMAVEFIGPLLETLWEGATIAFELFSDLMMIVFETIVEVATTVFDVVMNIVESVAPAFMAVLDMFMAGFEAVQPFIQALLPIVISVFSGIMSTISPIVGFIGTIISSIIGIISPIVAFIATIMANIFAIIKPIISFASQVFGDVSSIVMTVFNGISSFIGGVISTISGVIGGLTSVVSSVFGTISSIASSVMGGVSAVFTTVFGAIGDAWDGLTDMVSNIFDGISSSVETLVGHVKGFINGVIGGINAAIGLINKIPGVNISKIPQLQRGTDDWGGGFAYMNEGGRGELAMLPSGTQVIPHDVSMRYAREAGRQSGMIDRDVLSADHDQKGDIVIRVENMAIREEADIDKVARQLQLRTEETKRRKGIR